MYLCLYLGSEIFVLPSEGKIAINSHVERRNMLIYKVNHDNRWMHMKDWRMLLLVQYRAPYWARRMQFTRSVQSSVLSTAHAVHTFTVLFLTYTRTYTKYSQGTRNVIQLTLNVEPIKFCRSIRLIEQHKLNSRTRTINDPNNGKLLPYLELRGVFYQSWFQFAFTPTNESAKRRSDFYAML